MLAQGPEIVWMKGAGCWIQWSVSAIRLTYYLVSLFKCYCFFTHPFHTMKCWSRMLWMPGMWVHLTQCLSDCDLSYSSLSPTLRYLNAIVSRWAEQCQEQLLWAICLCRDSGCIAPWSPHMSSTNSLMTAVMQTRDLKCRGDYFPDSRVSEVVRVVFDNLIYHTLRLSFLPLFLTPSPLLLPSFSLSFLLLSSILPPLPFYAPSSHSSSLLSFSLPSLIPLIYLSSFSHPLLCPVSFVFVFFFFVCFLFSFFQF